MDSTPRFRVVSSPSPSVDYHSHPGRTGPSDRCRPCTPVVKRQGVVRRSLQSSRLCEQPLSPARADLFLCTPRPLPSNTRIVCPVCLLEKLFAMPEAVAVLLDSSRNYSQAIPMY